MPNRSYVHHQPQRVNVHHHASLPFIPSSSIHINIYCPTNNQLPPLPNAKSLHISSSILSSLHFPPSLTSLEFAIEDEKCTTLPSLPPCLTHLNIFLTDGPTDLSNLPISLTHLQIYTSAPNISLPALPPGLVYLSVTASRVLNLTSLPSSINYLKIETYLGGVILPSLPPNLEVLEVDSTDFQLPALPTSLKALIVRGYTGPIDEYPPNLTHLTTKTPNPAPFPKTLRVLELYSEYKPSSILELPSLVEFAGKCTMIPYLPPTVTKISLLSSSKDIPIPRSVTHLRLGYHSCEVMPPLHDNITHLILNNISVEEFPLALPPKLELLFIVNKDEDYIKEGSFPSFPPSLRFLIVPYVEDLPPFPPKLQTLEIYQQISHPPVLPLLPSSIRYLVLPNLLKEMDTNFGIQLPPHLTQLYAIGYKFADIPPLCKAKFSGTDEYCFTHHV